MKKISVKDAVGHVLCHDHTRIVKGEVKGVQFKKGHIVGTEDIPVLLDMGKQYIYIWEETEGFLHENDAAERLAALLLNDYIEKSAPHEGKIELTATTDGLFTADVNKLTAINSIDDIMVSCRHSLSPVKKGDKLAGTRVIPLVVSEDRIKEAEVCADKTPVLNVIKYKIKSACVITTGSEVATGRIKDTFTPVIKEKLSGYGITVEKHMIVGDEIKVIQNAISDAKNSDVDLIICTGGMSVDPDDNTPGAVKHSGARIVTYGAPVLPGAMFLLGYYEDNRPIVGLPGCVMYAAATIFDIVLPRIAAGVLLAKKDFAVMGNGGLCLSCNPCRYPVCPFGK